MQPVAGGLPALTSSMTAVLRTQPQQSLTFVHVLLLRPQDFLQRAELREYELERDKRLASDVRLRGRL